jgi:hypothetical protein
MEKALVEMHAECLLEIFKFRNVGLGQRLMGTDVYNAFLP